ncbi:SH3 domain signaling protein [Westerdykella ornata]|uniref:SH3 domain signaling protein n=1 Tax=Westerdykella ornata TaxID=318751 RepID=A0A6A6JPF3_WESOR|nr:SH3 domain signaling protein [Westerdykella ornata]KAF2278023.1 SH3 domain signaling protein [Westerdykella ornata]
MQRLQRKVGRFLPRTPNEADIEAMLRDFNDSDQMLEKIESAAKQWRDAWTNILAHQLAAIECMHSIYKPLGAKSSDYGSQVAVDTPAATLERCAQLQQAFSELKTDMMEEVADIEKKLITPARIARDSLKPMKKAIKKREDRKVDYERYKSRTEALQNKKTRSDRETSALIKHESDLTKATHEYQYADEALRTQLPRLNAATFSLLPHLLANQIVLQNNLIGNLYTVLNQYSIEQGYPDPPPELEEVVPVWESAFTPLRTELESSLELLRTGKAVRQPMRLPDQGSSLTGLGIRNKVIPGRRSSSNTSVPTVNAPRSPRPGHTLAPPSEGPPVPLSNKPSMSSLNTSTPRLGASPGRLTPPSATDQWGGSTPTVSYASANGAGTKASHDDYFGRQRILSTASSPNPAAGKKKPPPPPPKKIGSFHGEYVTAMYDFDGMNEGDLTFREGDRIRVVKKTNSSHDWWEGELRGEKGSFPANYCK